MEKFCEPDGKKEKYQNIKHIFTSKEAMDFELFYAIKEQTNHKTICNNNSCTGICKYCSKLQSTKHQE